MDSNLQAIRPVYAGKTFLSIQFEGSPQMATLRPNVFTAKEIAAGYEAEISNLSFEPGAYGS